MSEKIGGDPGFAPSDYTDGLKTGDWRGRYSDPEAKRGIRNEAVYLSTCFLVVSAGIVLMLCEMPQQWAGLSGNALRWFNISVGAWLAAMLGGAIFDIKWLIHCVAHGNWHLDRRLWRLLIPWISGAFGFITVVIVASGLFGLFDAKSVDSLPFIVSLGFLVGYFSDMTVAKLAEIAKGLFGETESHERQQ